MTCSVTPLSYAQLQQLALNAGFTKSQAPLMASIAMAESGGCPTSTNPYDNNGTQTSWGLWQISYGNHTAPRNWNDPQTNANLAYQKYKSQGYNAWGTYTSGKYMQYEQPGVTPATAGPGSGTPTNAALSSLPFGIGGAITALQESLINALEEIGIFFLALIIIILGVIILNADEIKGISKKVAGTI